MERLTVRANYTVAGTDGKTIDGAIEFIARIRDASKGTNAIVRAKRAVSRRLNVRLKAVTITGVMTY